MSSLSARSAPHARAWQAVACVLCTALLCFRRCRKTPNLWMILQRASAGPVQSVRGQRVRPRPVPPSLWPVLERRAALGRARGKGEKELEGGGRGKRKGKGGERESGTETNRWSRLVASLFSLSSLVGRGGAGGRSVAGLGLGLGPRG